MRGRTRQGSCLLAIGLVHACACPFDEASTSAEMATDAAIESAAGGKAGPVEGDPLLAEARGRIANGRLPDDVVNALLASDDPAHARARRLLEAMADGGEQDEEELEDAPDEVARVVPPKIGEAASGETSSTDGVAVGPAAATGPAAAQPTPRSSTQRSGSRSSLSAMSLQGHARGATLTLHAAGGVVVGVASQPRSGIVRLVVESSGAAAKVLSARPRVTGARVTGVRAGTDTVMVTVELDPGWSLGHVERTSAGARIHFRRSS